MAASLVSPARRSAGRARSCRNRLSADRIFPVAASAGALHARCAKLPSKLAGQRRSGCQKIALAQGRGNQL